MRVRQARLTRRRVLRMPGWSGLGAWADRRAVRHERSAGAVAMRICFIGDSFVNGTGDPHCLGWTGRICAVARRAGHDLTYYNLGIRRETSTDIRARWRDEAFRRLPASEPAGLVFSFGTNDTTIEDGRERVPPVASVEHAAAILREAERRCPVLMVGPPPLADDDQNRRIVALSRQFERLCKQFDLPYLP